MKFDGEDLVESGGKGVSGVSGEGVRGVVERE